MRGVKGQINAFWLRDNVPYARVLGVFYPKTTISRKKVKFGAGKNWFVDVSKTPTFFLCCASLVSSQTAPQLSQLHPQPQANL